jgi:hypothetical protein
MIVLHQNVRGSGHPALPVRSGGLGRKGGEISWFIVYFGLQNLFQHEFLLLVRREV